jgi:hypothetical protein
MNEERVWLIRKGGYYYRENWCGYTAEKIAAGRYTEKEARREAAVEPDNIFAIHQDGVADDFASKIVADLNAQIADLRAERDEALDWIRRATALITNEMGGGSEMFVRNGENYRADMPFICARIRDLRNRYHDAMHAKLRAERDAVIASEVKS